MYSIAGILILLIAAKGIAAQELPDTRLISGVVVTQKDEALSGISVIARGRGFERITVTGENGEFRMKTPRSDVTLLAQGPYIRPQETTISAESSSTSVRLQVEFFIPPIHQSIVITAPALQPDVETTAEVSRQSLFARDDQLLDTLAAGINAGQHEGGGKSLEIRRFGFNTDHGGVNGGLKVLVDNVQQNQVTQGHGQGYLGALKSLTPELVEDIQIVNGPFSSEYGDFSGLGVVHIRLKEALRNHATIRLQAGSFGSYRTFLAYSPTLARADSFLSYEGSRTDGPFDHPLGYKRDNVTGNYTRHIAPREDVGLRINFGRNDFSSSGQIPLDLVSSGQLSRFGAIDPTTGGRVRLGTTGAFYRKSLESGANFKLDGFLSRSLFDLYSNFTMFLNDTEQGDGIQQHDSRYQEGVNAQYLHPFKWFGNPYLLTAGTNFHDNQINVGLFPSDQRRPLGVTTLALARVTNGAGYVNQSTDLLRGRLHIVGGLRWDYFRFKVNDRINPIDSGIESSAKFQPKAGIAYSPTKTVPVTLTFNYGRGINTQDARGVVQNPAAPEIATTDFYQVGASVHTAGVSFVSDLFLIDRSNEQVYIPDDGGFELSDPSRSYGFESKLSLRAGRHLTFNAGLTQTMNSFYKGTTPRLYVDSAPHTVANAGVTFTGWQGVYTSLRWRHVSSYRLNGLDPSVRASGLDVLDLALTKSLRPGLDLNLELDNLTNKVYYETQNYFESRISPTALAIERIHGTPGYPFGLTLGMTFRLGEK